MNIRENRLINALKARENNTIDRIKNKNESVDKVTKETKILLENAEQKLLAYSKDKKLSEKQYKDFRRKIEHPEESLNPGIIKQIISEMEKTVEQNKADRISEEEAKKPLEPEAPPLMELQKEYFEILEQYKDQIGEKQVKEYKNWLENERKKIPTVENMKDLIRKLKEKELPPRIEAFNYLNKTAIKFGIKNIKELDWTKQGLTEKNIYVKTAKQAEVKIKESIEKDLALPEQNKEAMQEVLEAKTPLEAQEALNKINKIVEKESENFTHLRAPIRIGKHSLKIMSKKEEKEFLKYYRERPFKERLVNLNLWPGFLKETRDLSEKLAKKLIDLYKNEPENLKLALRTFEEQSFKEKEKSLKENERLLQEKSLEKRKKILLKKACMTEVNSCDFISQIDKKKFKEWYDNEDNYKNPETGEKGDIKELEKCHKILISKTPDSEAGNIAAYKHYHKRHQIRITELKELDPNVSESEIIKWKKSYDQSGFKDRKNIHLELIERIDELKEEQKKDKKIENKVEMTEEEKTSAEKLNVNKSELMKGLDKLSKQDKYGEAMILLMQYIIKNPDEREDKEIIKYRKFLDAAIDLKGPGDAIEEKAEKEIEAGIDRELKAEKKKKELKEQQVKTLKLEGMQEDEKENEHKKAHKESVQRAGSDKIKKGIIEDFYEKEDEHIIDEQGYGRKKQDINFTKEKMRDEDLKSLRKTIYRDQSRLDENKDIQGVVLKDEQGRELNKQEAERMQENELEKMTDETSKNALKDREDISPGKNVSNLSAKIAAKRAARQKIDKLRNERLEAA